MLAAIEGTLRPGEGGRNQAGRRALVAGGEVGYIVHSTLALQ